MTNYSKIIFYVSFLFAGFGIQSCSNHVDKDKPAKDSSTTTIRKETKKDPDVKFQRPPIVNIVDTVTPRSLIIFMKDSAATYARISLKLGKIYGVKLPDYLKKNKLKTVGAPMAWYKKQKAPYFFEAGIPVNKKGIKSVPGVQIREIVAGKAIIAHFYGPYELLPVGYDAIKEWMKDNKKVPAAAPYEIYLTDPIDKNGKPVDPYKIQTDIIFPIK